MALMKPAVELLLDLMGGKGLAPAGSLNWEELHAAARSHGLAPWLYSQLKTEDKAAVPPGVMQALRMDYMATASRNMIVYRDLKVLLNTFAEAGVAVILLKGVYLADAIYGSLALRPMGDIDLLVRQGDLKTAGALMTQLGYQPLNPYDAENEDWKQHLPSFSKPGALPVEIHWTIMDPEVFELPPAELAGLWQRAREVKVNGLPALTLSAEDMFLHLCLHISSHHQFVVGLNHLLDLQLVMRREPDLDWKALAQRARIWGGANGLYLTLRVLREVLGVDVPTQALALLNPGRDVDDLLEWAVNKLIGGAREGPSSRVVKLAGEENLGSRARIIWSRLFPAREELAYHYHADPSSWKINLFYFVRIKDMLARYGMTGWRILRGDPEVAGPALREKQLREFLQH
ncbi:MAG TPA: nucleotidyltransferase family protein [Anaerolineaceae bacterium]|nr:nucleotidyltransferase family protein [Anaerolineaceae bacterium]